MQQGKEESDNMTAKEKEEENPTTSREGHKKRKASTTTITSSSSSASLNKDNEKRRRVTNVEKEENEEPTSPIGVWVRVMLPGKGNDFGRSHGIEVPYNYSVDKLVGCVLKLKKQPPELVFDTYVYKVSYLPDRGSSPPAPLLSLQVLN